MNMKNNRLVISDLDKLKITKVKYYAIYFSYGDRYYILKEGSDSYYSDFELYERVIDKNGYIKEVNYLCSGSIEYVEECIRYKGRNCFRLHGANKHIDKEYFVEQLYNNGYIKRNEE